MFGDYSLIGGGWSFNLVPLELVPGVRVGINDSCIHVPCQIAISMDRLWTEYRWTDLCRMRIATYIRKSVLKNVDWKEHERKWLFPFENDILAPSLAIDPNRLDGSNSGMCALNLVYYKAIVGIVKRVFLFGFDMSRGPQGEPYWYPPYPWAPEGATKVGKYREWSLQFKVPAEQFKLLGIPVFNVSKISAIPFFPTISIEELGKMERDDDVA